MKLDIGMVLTKSVDIIRENPAIFVPALLPFVFGLIFAALGVGAMGGMGGAMFTMPMAFSMAFVGMILVATLLMLIVSLIAVGSIVYMTKEQLNNRKVSFNEGISAAMSKIGNLFVAAIIISVGTMIGMILLVIPALIWLLFVAFTIPVVMLENVDAVEGIKRSINLVKTNLGDVVVFLIVLLIILLVVGFVLNLIPFLGSALSALVTTTYSGVALTIAYLQLKG
ncbi:MAG: hypothetical protein QFX40_03600 [Archaeoglobales archaeon]|nr:hypothetical protein [Archaeoglobales archaeon]